MSVPEAQASRSHSGKTLPGQINSFQVFLKHGDERTGFGHRLGRQCKEVGHVLCGRALAVQRGRKAQGMGVGQRGAALNPVSLPFASGKGSMCTG